MGGDRKKKRTPSFEWKNAAPGFEIKSIFYNPSHQRITIQFDTAEHSIGALEKLAMFDRRCQVLGPLIVLSKGRNPHQLGNYLLEQGMIDHACFAELQEDLREYGQELRGGDGHPGP